MKIQFAALGTLLLAGGLHAQTPLPAWQLEVARDSFVINFSGRPMGFTVLAVERAGDGFRVTEQTRIGNAVEQDTEIMLDADQRITSVKQDGKSRGQEMRIAITYADNHVNGSATVPQMDGTIKTHDIDMDLPANVVDDNLLQLVLGVLPFSGDTHYTIPVFSAGRNAITETPFVVVGTETLELAGGPVAAYKAELRGMNVVNFWISKSAPHRVLKTAPVGPPIEIILAN